MARAKIKIGDVLEIPAPPSFAFVQYLGKHAMYGDAIRVCPTLQPNRPASFAGLFDSGYVTFFPAGLAVRESVASVVGHLPAPSIPARFRRPGAIVGRVVLNWLVDTEHGEVSRAQLSAEELAIPIAGIWNLEYLITRVSEGWRPEYYGGPDRRTIEPVIAEVPAEERCPSVEHYLYFPREQDAAQVGIELREKGFEAEVRLGADGVNWLVLAKHRIEGEADLESAQDLMQQATAKLGGEYDGFEVEVIDEGG